MNFVDVIEELKREKSRLRGRFVTAVQGVIAAFNCSAESARSAGHSVKMLARTSRVAKHVVESLERKEQR
jgi:hypothetical protein